LVLVWRITVILDIITQFDSLYTSSVILQDLVNLQIIGNNGLNDFDDEPHENQGTIEMELAFDDDKENQILR
jgi:hypothetical protein